MTLQDVLEAAREAHPAPGAVAGVSRDGVVELAASGVRDVRSGLPMTPDTAFLTGSITKVWATALALTVVEQGALDLATAVREVLPDRSFGRQRRWADRITVQQLLNHASGTDAGDLLVDTGPYPDGLSAYLELLAGVGHLHRPGEHASYNNAGWLVLDEVLHRVTGRRFDALLRERVIEALDLPHSRLQLGGGAAPDAAVGHFPAADGFVPTPEFLMPGSLVAAGTNLLTTAADSLRVLEACAYPGLLTRDAAARMCTPTIADPPGPDSGFCLGWRYRRRDGVGIVWHGGGSYGGYAVAAVDRSRRISIVSYANSSHSMGLHEQLFEAVLGPRSPLGGDDELVPQESLPTDLARYAGCYERVSCRVHVDVRGDALRVRVEDVDADWPGGRLYRSGQTTSYDAVLVSPTAAVSVGPVQAGVPARLHFLEPGDDGAFALLYQENRLARRVGTAVTPSM